MFSFLCQMGKQNLINISNQNPNLQKRNNNKEYIFNNKQKKPIIKKKRKKKENWEQRKYRS